MVINTSKFLHHKSMSTTMAHSLKAAIGKDLGDVHRGTYSNSKETMGRELKAGIADMAHRPTADLANHPH
jgi:hypothetical protein